MKLFVILIFGLVLAACAPQTTLEELEDQALLTGDWSQVEKRERLMRRKAMRDAHENVVCPDDLRAVCEKHFGETRCSCVDSNTLRNIFANF